MDPVTTVGVSSSLLGAGLDGLLVLGGQVAGALVVANYLDDSVLDKMVVIPMQRIKEATEKLNLTSATQLLDKKFLGVSIESLTQADSIRVETTEINRRLFEKYVMSSKKRWRDTPEDVVFGKRSAPQDSYWVKKAKVAALYPEQCLAGATLGMALGVWAAQKI
jgi:hypothetical protein